MKYSLRTENMTLSQVDQQHLDDRLDRLKRHLLTPYEMNIFLSHDHHHKSGPVITCKINIHQSKKVFHTERTGDTVQAAFDEALLAIKHELDKEHDKKKQHRP